MNPISMINQEFARVVVEDWSDEGAMRRQEQELNKSRGGIFAAIRALVSRLRARIDRGQGTADPTPLTKTTN